MKKYIIPECVCISIEKEDVIRTSGNLTGISDQAGIGGNMDFGSFFPSNG